MTPDASNVGHRKTGDVRMDPKTKDFVLMTSFGTFRLKVSEETPINDRQRLGVLDILNGKKP